MKTTRTAILLFGVCLFAAGCRGKIMGTAELKGAGTADAHFVATGGPVVLWADTDGKWTSGGNGKHARFPVHYEIDVLQKGAKLAHLACDTKDSTVSVCGSEVSINNSHSGDCELKLGCAVPTIPAGETTLHVTATPGREASEIHKMNLNVRAD